MPTTPIDVVHHHLNFAGQNVLSYGSWVLTAALIAAAELRKRARSSLDLLALFAIFPVTMFGANFGAGAAVIIGIHLGNPTTAIVTVLTLVSIGCALLLIRLAASLLPAASPATAPHGTAVPSGRLAAARATK